MKIYKYQILTKDLQVVDIPRGSKFLSLQMQNGAPMIWLMVPSESFSADTELIVRVVGTGNGPGIEDGLRFLGTYQLQGGEFVGHVFCEKGVLVDE